MNGRSAVMLIVAVVCGLGAMVGAQKLLVKKNQPETTSEVLVTARDLAIEEVLKPELVTARKLPASQVPAGSFASYKDVAGRWVKIPMLAGEPILEAKLAPKDQPPGLLARIPHGMRAFALEVNEQSGVSGFVLPDYHVDVVLARHSSGDKPPEAETILQDVLVLAAGQTTTRPDDKSIEVRTVTLALTPEQVRRVVAARTEGTLSLSLRGHKDDSIVAEAAPKPRAPDPVPVPAPAPLPAPAPPPPPTVAVARVEERRPVYIFRPGGKTPAERVERVGGGGAPTATAAVPVPPPAPALPAAPAPTVPTPAPVPPDNLPDPTLATASGPPATPSGAPGPTAGLDPLTVPPGY